MSDEIRLFTGPLSMFGMKVEIALREKGLEFDRVSVPFDFSKGYAPKHPEVVSLNPKHQVPVLVEDDLALFDSTQIFEYLEERTPLPPLWPRDRRARAEARLLELQSDEIYFPHIVKLMGLQKQLGSPVAAEAIRCAEEFTARMDKRLGSKEFFFEAFSYVDIAFYMALLFGERLGAPLSSSHSNISRWRSRVSSRPTVQASLAPMIAFLKANRGSVPEYIKASE